jgi:hypothetical protein
MQNSQRFRVVKLAGVLLALWGGSALAQPVVATVPWVPAQHLIPHDVISGRATRLKGAEIPQNGVYQGVSYRWQYGDGADSGWQALANDAARRVIEGSRTYNGAAGSPFTAVLTICTAANGGGACNSANYRMTIRDNTLTARVNVAIDEGLWYLYKAHNPATGQFSPAGSYGGQESSHGAAVNAFFAHGHLETYDPNTNPYVNTVRGGMRFLFSRVNSYGIANKNAGNPDVNGNGRGASLSNQSIYENGMIMDAIVTSGTPDADVTTGAYAALQVGGREARYSDVLQDFVDGYSFAQMDNNRGFPQRGSWNYVWAAGHADNSSSQWAAIGMIPAEREWALTIPAFVKSENNQTIRSMWTPGTGTIGYDSAACAWGCAATTPSGMVQWIMDGRRSDDPEFALSVRWLADNWGSGPNEANTNLLLGYTYGLFAGVKALRLSQPAVVTLRRSNNTEFDWYNDPARRGPRGHQPPARRRWLQRAQLHRHGRPGHPVVAADAGRQPLRPGPPGGAAGHPIRAAINQEVTFDHSQSFHLDPNQRHGALRVGFRWRRQLRLQHRQPQRAADLPLQPGPQSGAPGLHCRPAAGDRRPEPGSWCQDRQVHHGRLGQRAAGGGHYPGKPLGPRSTSTSPSAAPTASIPTPARPSTTASCATSGTSTTPTGWCSSSGAPSTSRPASVGPAGSTARSPCG